MPKGYTNCRYCGNLIANKSLGDHIATEHPEVIRILRPKERLLKILICTLAFSYMLNFAFSDAMPWHPAALIHRLFLGICSAYLLTSALKEVKKLKLQLTQTVFIKKTE